MDRNRYHHAVAQERSRDTAHADTVDHRCHADASQKGQGHSHQDKLTGHSEPRGNGRSDRDCRSATDRTSIDGQPSRTGQTHLTHPSSSIHHLSLLDPPENQPVGWRDTILLKWSPAGELAEDEYYHVHVERPPKTDAEQWYGDYVYTKDVEQLLRSVVPGTLPPARGPRTWQLSIGGFELCAKPAKMRTANR